MLLAGALAPATGHTATVTVFAAASLKEALDAQAQALRGRAAATRSSCPTARSNALARQIEAGAPADVFISADTDWMDYLDTRKLLAPGTRVDLLGNTLVLIAPAASTSTLRIAPNFALAAALGADRLAMANPDSVPAGKYGKARPRRRWACGRASRSRSREPRTSAPRSRWWRAARRRSASSTRPTRSPTKGVRIVDTFPADTHPPDRLPDGRHRGQQLARSSQARSLAYLALRRGTRDLGEATASAAE